MRFHVVALPHTITSKEYVPCAYTQKVYNFCKMMRSLGHEVFHYGGHGSNPPCSEHITIVTPDEHKLWWGDNDWKREFFNIEWDSKLDYWQVANARAIAFMRPRLQQKDFICLIGGNCQKPIADAFPNHMAVEFGIGYTGTFSKYRVFESHAWRHYCYGMQAQWNKGAGNFYDVVIPNYFDPEDFPVATTKEDYFLFVGRLIYLKGIEMAVEITRRLGRKLIICGQGVTRMKPGEIASREITIKGDHVEYAGVVDIARRGELMAKAQALFAPTLYVGPFEGVSVESLFCGTPVITTDWGSFTENNLDGRTGYRVRTVGEGTWACRNLDKLWGPQRLRRYAIEHFSLDEVRYQYEEYFTQLMGLWDKGWYSEDYSPIRRRNSCVGNGME